MTFLIALFARWGFSERIARAAALLSIVAVSLACAALLALLLKGCVREREDQAVQLDRAEWSAEVMNRVVEAERAASANEAARIERDAINNKELSDEAAKGGAEPVGGAVAGVLNRMREQQEAGRR